AVQQRVDAFGVVGRHSSAAIEPTGALARLVLEQVPTVGFLADDLPGPGAPEPLRRPAVRLGLRHVSSVLDAGQSLVVLVAGQFGDDSASSPAGPAAGPSGCRARARVLAPRCGASTIVMLRPSCLAEVSTKP